MLEEDIGYSMFSLYYTDSNAIKEKWRLVLRVNDINTVLIQFSGMQFLSLAHLTVESVQD